MIDYIYMYIYIYLHPHLLHQSSLINQIITSSQCWFDSKLMFDASPVASLCPQSSFELRAALRSGRASPWNAQKPESMSTPWRAKHHHNGWKKGVRSCEIDWYILVQGIAWYCCAELCSLVQLKSFRFDALNTRVDARLCLVNSVHLHLMAVWCNIFSPFWQRIASHPLISCHIQVISQIPGQLCIKPLHEFDSFLHIKAAFWHT